MSRMLWSSGIPVRAPLSVGPELHERPRHSGARREFADSAAGGPRREPDANFQATLWHCPRCSLLERSADPTQRPRPLLDRIPKSRFRDRHPRQTRCLTILLRLHVACDRSRPVLHREGDQETPRAEHGVPLDRAISLESSVSDDRLHPTALVCLTRQTSPRPHARGGDSRGPAGRCR